MIKRATSESVGLTFRGDPNIEGSEDRAKYYRDLVDAYLFTFEKPIKNAAGYLVCTCCGEQLAGIGGRFEWGLASGHGYCGECGWPVVAHHSPKDADGVALFAKPFQVLLCYTADAVGDRALELFQCRFPLGTTVAMFVNGDVDWENLATTESNVWFENGEFWVMVDSHNRPINAKQLRTF